MQLNVELELKAGNDVPAMEFEFLMLLLLPSLPVEQPAMAPIQQFRQLLYRMKIQAPAF